MEFMLTTVRDFNASVAMKETAFWCLVALVTHIMPEGYYSNTAVAVNADMRVLNDVLARWSPSVHVDFEMQNLDPALVSDNSAPPPRRIHFCFGFDFL